MTAESKARVFRNGRSQAVRIPAEYRFATDKVYIERDARTGVVRLSEKPFRPSLDDIYRDLDASGAADFELDRSNAPPAERDWL
jgi:antitoxin VapB